MNQSQSTAEASTPLSKPLLALTGFSKSFGPVEALKDVDLELHAGQVVGLVGEGDLHPAVRAGLQGRRYLVSEKG